MRSRCWIALICVSVFINPLSAGLNILDSSTEISSSGLTLDFTGLVEGAAGGAVFNAWGISLESANGGEPVVVRDIIGGQPLSAISNPDDGMSAGNPLVINFRQGVRQFGVTLRNGDPQTSADLTAFDNLGNLLGQVHIDNVNTTFGPFVGFETTEENELITKVVIDYGDSIHAEQFIDLSLTFPQVPFFTSYLAQIGDGAIPNSSNFLQTSIIVTNLTNTTAQGEVRVTGDDGDPLELTFVDEDTGEAVSPAGGAGLVPVFPVAPFSSRVFTTVGTDFSPPAQGYAEIRSNVPVSTTSVFRFVVNGQAFEAGVGGSAPLHRILAAVSRAEGGFDSGIAVANPNDEPVSASVTLLNAGGGMVAQNTDFLDLEAREHVAGFLPALFPDIDENFQGSILINSALPLVVTVLRTVQGGVVSASLPVGGTEQP